MWYDWKELFCMVSVPIGLLILALVPVVAVKAYQCGHYETMSGKQTSFEWFDGCYVKTDSGWQRWQEYKFRAAASEGLRELAKDNE